VSGNTQLVDFNPLPKGLYSERRFRRMTLAAKAVLFGMHQRADDREEDGFLDRGDVRIVLAEMGVEGDADRITAELASAGYVEVTDSGDLLLVNFRGLGKESRDERRTRWREKKRRQRAQASPNGVPRGTPPGTSPEPSPRMSR